MKYSSRLIAPTLAVALCALSIWITWFFLDISRHGLPSRPPTGNHGQGHSPTADCPDQYKQPVEVDGTEYPLTCFGKIAQFADETKSPNAPFTEKTLVFSATVDGKMTADVVTVPSMSEFKAYICFALQGKRALQCLYIAKTHEVIQRPVIPDGQDL